MNMAYVHDIVKKTEQEQKTKVIEGECPQILTWLHLLCADIEPVRDQTGQGGYQSAKAAQIGSQNHGFVIGSEG